MRAELKSLFVYLPPEPVIVDGVETGRRTPEPEDHTPLDPGYFGYHAQVFIGSADDSWSNSFDVVVCTPRWLADNFQHGVLARSAYESSNLLYGNSLVLMQTWDPVELRRSIESICSDTVGLEWGPVANSIGRWLPWEYQYKYEEEDGLEKVPDRTEFWSTARKGPPAEDSKDAPSG